MPKKRNAPAGPDAVMDGKVNCGVREILKEMDGMETTGLDCGGMGKPLVAGKGEGAEGWQVPGGETIAIGEWWWLGNVCKQPE